MAKFTTTIQLFEAEEKDYAILHNELEKRSTKGKNQVVKGKAHAPGKEEYNWKGNITIQEVADAIFRAATKTGRKYSFSIIRDKRIANSNP
ncbi:MAG TPA: hypothetical protein VJU78_02340 [Chitinophagaceae bacterium]|nr:hypothetical protein [Chitinophagaceae bacterium]